MADHKKIPPQRGARSGGRRPRLKRGRRSKESAARAQPLLDLRNAREAFAARLDVLMRTRGLSRSAFARAIGASLTNMNKYLSGTTQPGFDKLYAIAHVAEVSLDWLIWDPLGEGGQTPLPISRYRTSRDLRHDLAAHLRAEIEAMVATGAVWAGRSAMDGEPSIAEHLAAHETADGWTDGRDVLDEFMRSEQSKFRETVQSATRAALKREAVERSRDALDAFDASGGIGGVDRKTAFKLLAAAKVLYPRLLLEPAAPGPAARWADAEGADDHSG